MRLIIPPIPDHLRRAALITSAAAAAIGWITFLADFIFLCSRAGILGATIEAVPAFGAAGLITGMLARSIWAPVIATGLLVAYLGGWPIFLIRGLGCSSG